MSDSKFGQIAQRELRASVVAAGLGHMLPSRVSLSVLCSQVYRIRLDAREMLDDPIGAHYGVSCIAAEHAERWEAQQLRELFTRSGWSLDEYRDELAQRVSGRSAYVLDLDVSVDDLYPSPRPISRW